MAPDFKVDTGAVSGENVGNREKKDAQSIVPELDEDGNDAEDLSNYPMPDKRVTTHTYKTASGEEFSFQIQWPNSFTEVVDHKWQTFETYDSTKWTTIDLKDQTDEKYYDEDPTKTKNPKSYTATQLKKSIETITKGMYNWWAAESAKLAYDSYGVDFNGKLLKVDFMVNQARTQAVTVPDDKKDNDTTPANEISEV